MTTSSIVIDKAQQLAADGRHTEVIAYLGARDANEIEESPNLALLYASRDSDVGTAGRCSTNLGIISHLRGRHAEAIASWEIALAAFDRAGWRPGVAQCHHNLGLTYRDQGALDRALTEADWAVT